MTPASETPKVPVQGDSALQRAFADAKTLSLALLTAFEKKEDHEVILEHIDAFRRKHDQSADTLVVMALYQLVEAQLLHLNMLEVSIATILDAIVGTAKGVLDPKVKEFCEKVYSLAGKSREAIAHGMAVELNHFYSLTEVPTGPERGEGAEGVPPTGGAETVEGGAETLSETDEEDG